MSFVDRTRQLATLSAAFEDADRGRGRVVLVTGGLAGGKTALLRKYCDIALVQGTRVLTATGARAERRLRMGLIDQLFATAALPTEVMDRARGLLVDPPCNDDVHQSDAHTVRALCDLLLELTKSGPVVIGVDDVHFADAASLQVLLYLCRRLDQARILLILTEWAWPLPTQPLFIAELTRLPHDVVELEPLSVKGIAELVAALTGESIPLTAAGRVHRLTGGNPLLVRALVRDNDWLAAGAAYRQAVLSCLHRWEPQLLLVAQAIAVLDEHANVELTAILAGLATATVTPLMEVLTDAGLLQGCRFRHEQGAAAVLDAIPSADRADMHLRAAELLYQRGMNASEVSGHLIAGGVVPGSWAIPVLRATAKQALADDNVELVVAALDLALTSCTDEQGRMEITELLARALWRVNPALAAPRLQALDENKSSPAMVVRHLLWQGDFEEHATLAGDVAPLDMVAFLVGHQWIYGGLEPRLFGACVKLLDANGLSPSIEAALALCTQSHTGQIVRNATYVLQSCRLDDSTVEIIVGALFALLHVDEPDLAEHWCTVLKVEATGRGATTWQALLTAMHAAAMLHKGDLEQTVALAEEALAILPGPGWGVIISLPLTVLLTAYTALGRHEEAEELSKRIVPPTVDRTMVGVKYLRARGHHRLGACQALAALEDFVQCVARLPDCDLDRPELLPWRTDLAQAHLHMDNRQLAFELATEELRLCGSPRSRGLAMRVLAACGEPRRRPALLAAAVEQLREGGDRLELARAMAELSRAYDELGDFSRARAVAGHAGQEVTVSGSGLSDAELRVARLAALGHTNREISQRLSITASTVEQHLTRVYRKLKVRSRVDLPERLSGVATEVLVPRSMVGEGRQGGWGIARGIHPMRPRCAGS